MDQLNGLSQDQSKMVFQQAEMINSIESNTVEAKNNIERAVVDIKQADDANKSTGEWINKLIYIVIFIVILLLILSALMPK
jgi:t-SNARE complex subunit (syntaxin)